MRNYLFDLFNPPMNEINIREDKNNQRNKGKDMIDEPSKDIKLT